MVSLDCALSFIKNLNDAAKRHLSRCAKATEKAERRKELARQEKEDFAKTMKANIDDYIAKNFKPVSASVRQFMSNLKEEYEAEYETASKFPKRVPKSYEECLSSLQEESKVFNSLIDALDTIDLDESYPVKEISVEDETVVVKTSKGTSSHGVDEVEKDLTVPRVYDEKLISDLFVSGFKIIALVESLSSLYESKIDVPSLNEKNEKLLKEYNNEIETQRVKTANDDFEKELNSQERKEAYLSFFKDLDATEHAAKPDPDAGSEQFKEAIQMGYLKLPVCDKSRREGKARLKLLNKVDVLKERINDGFLAFPLVADLKEKGNVLLNFSVSSEGVYPEFVKAFINQLIISFTLSFPCSKVHLKLVDVGNKAGFSVLSALQKISPNIFLDGIVRDEKDLDDAIRHIKRLKLEAEDKLNLDAMANIFEYNKKMEAAPMDVYLFVLVDFPSKITSSHAKDLLTIVRNGKDCGIFSIIAHNLWAPLEYNFSSNEHWRVAREFERVSYVFEDRGQEFTFTSDCSRYSLELLDGVNRENLAHIVEVLSGNVRNEASKPIPLTKMFEYMDSHKVPGVSEEFEIPFGMAGADVQTLELGAGPHSAVIGGTGSGKSIFFHTLILDACYRYSPDELNFYLLDFKGGMEFSYYKEFKLPHIKLIGMTKDMNDGLSIFINLRDEMLRRMKIFAEEGADNIQSYYKRGNRKKIARLFVIVDEIQEIFREDGISEKALSLLSEILAQGRACGINVLWGSQSVPSVPGIDNAVMQNIANRICLKVEDTGYARRLFSEGTEVQAVEDIKNRPEKGYGVIADQRTNGKLKEFRVAYSESRENRGDYYEIVRKKWASFESENNVYVLGEDFVPDVKKDGSFAFDPLRDVPSSVVSDGYALKLGVGFVSGLPYFLNVKLFGTNSNVVFVGTGEGAELLRDLMGFSLLSVLCSRCLDCDALGSQDNKIYYVNKEVAIGPKLVGDLYNSLAKENQDRIANVSSLEKFKNAVKDLYAIYLNRVETIENGEFLGDSSSYFMFIHYFQNFAEALEKNEPLEDGGFGLDGGLGDSLGLKDALKTLFSKGSDYGIHFIISLNGAGFESVYSIKKEMLGFSYKVGALGCDLRSLSTNSTSRVPSIPNDKICVCCANGEFTKIRPYRYDATSKEDAAWRKKIVDEFSKASKEGE